MENNTLETITEQQQYRKGSKEECLQKGRPQYEENRERPQKMARDSYRV